MKKTALFGLSMLSLVLLVSGCALIRIILPPYCGVVNPTNGHRYCLTDEGLAWHEARENALQRGGYLVAINNQWDDVGTGIIEFP